MRSNVLVDREARPAPSQRHRDDNRDKYVRTVFISKAPGNDVDFAARDIQVFNVSGDHLTINRIDGCGVVQVRFQSDAPWITVQQGDVIIRDYVRLYVRDVGGITSSDLGPRTKVEFFSSYGPLIFRNDTKNSVKAGFITANGVLPADTPFDIVNAINLLLGAGSPSIAGQVTGGPLTISVRSTSASALRVYYDKLTAAAYITGGQGFIIEPGQSMSFDYEGKLDAMPGPSATTFVGMLISAETAGATCTVSIMANRGGELTDNETAYQTFNVTPLDMG